MLILYTFLFLINVFILFYGYYYIFGIMYGCSKKLDKYEYIDFKPKVSLITATYNEAAIINYKIKNILELTYPPEKLEIIFIDCSNDTTTNILCEFKNKSPLDIKVIHEVERKGLASALNLGYSFARGDLVIKSDCDIFLKPDSIENIVSFFGDNRVGCVSGIGEVDIDLEKSYRSIQTQLRIAESNLYSTYLLDTFCCFRRNLIEPISPNSVADDAELALKIIRKGYKSLINPKAKFYESCASSFRDRRKQRDRRAEGHIRLLLENIDIIFNPKFGYFGMIIFPSIFFMMIISPWWILIIYIIGFLITVQISLYYSLIYLFITIFFIYSLYKVPLMSKPGSFIDSQISLMIAQFGILRRKESFIWDKIDR